MSKSKREIMEKAFGTFERNKLIRFLFANGIAQCQIARAFDMKRKRVHQICHPEREVENDKPK